MQHYCLVDASDHPAFKLVSNLRVSQLAEKPTVWSEGVDPSADTRKLNLILNKGCFFTGKDFIIK